MQTTVADVENYPVTETPGSLLQGNHTYQVSTTSLLMVTRCRHNYISCLQVTLLLGAFYSKVETSAVCGLTIVENRDHTPVH